MTIAKTLSAAALGIMLAAGAASAAPCATGTTTNSQGQKTTDVTSKADGDSTAKVTPGAKAESPGTVGALNNVGSNTQPAPGEAKPPEGKVISGQNSNDC